MGIFRQFPYSNFHDMNMDWLLSKMKEVLTDVDNVEDLVNSFILDITQQIADDVNDWITAHPEYVTTVMDGAISEIKLDNNLKALTSAGSFNPDSYEGTDAEKLQQAIDAAVASVYGTVIVSRKYDITGSSLYINKTLYDPTTRTRENVSFIFTGSGEIQKKDSGYIFTSQEAYNGDITFFNGKFKGKDAFDASANKDAMCSVFDCHRLIRITTYGCSYTILGTVFDGKESTGPTDNMQSIRNYGDVCTYSHAYYKIQTLWGAVSYGCLIEQCDYGYIQANSSFLINELHIINTTIEGCSMGGIIFNDNANGNARGIIVDGCYFEANGTYDSGQQNITYDIRLNIQYNYASRIMNNVFVPHPNGRCIEMLIRNNTHHITDNICTSAAAGAVLIYVIPPSSGIPPRIFGQNFASSITITNDDTIMVDAARNGFHSFFNGLVANGFNTNLDQFTYFGNVTVRILTADNATGVPTGVTQGILHQNGKGGDFIQTLCTPTDNYIRARLSGVGWTSWTQI